MPYTAVIFDLYGTLVGSFSRRGYDRIQAEMADILGVPTETFWHAMAETLTDRTTGSYRSFKANIVEICRRLNSKAEQTQIARIVGLHHEFTKAGIVPEAAVLETLGLLNNRGFRIGLITNCNANVPKLFPDSPLAEYIQTPVFSCEVGLKKPAPGIYEIACERLDVLPAECIYVGDGSSEELTAAAALGMLPILKRTDLTDVYDPHRPEVEHWHGIAIDAITELGDVISALT